MDESMNPSWTVIPEMNVCAHKIDESSLRDVVYAAGDQEESKGAVSFTIQSPEMILIAERDVQMPD